MNDQTNKRYKGYIQCPICKAKEFVEEGATGKVSHYCACGRLLESDYDRMTAKETKPVRGGIKTISKRLAI